MQDLPISKTPGFTMPRQAEAGNGFAYGHPPQAKRSPQAMYSPLALGSTQALGGIAVEIALVPFELDPHSADFGSDVSASGSHSIHATLANVGLDTGFAPAEIGPNLGDVGSYVAEADHHLVDIGPTLANLD